MDENIEKTDAPKDNGIDLSKESPHVQKALNHMADTYMVYILMDKVEKTRFKELMDVISKDWEE